MSKKSLAKKFLRNQKGNASIFFAMAAIPVLVATGGAIDVGRFVNARAQVTIALDAGVLAAATTYSMHTGTPDQAKAAAIAEANKQFNKAVKTADDLAEFTPEFDMNTAQDGFTGIARTTMDTQFLTFAGIPQMEVNRESEALMGRVVPSGDLEVSLMLDTTGSMCNDQYGPCLSDSKMLALKTAASQLIDKVIWADQSTFTSKVALVPFANRVRLAANGATSPMFTAMTNLPNTWTGWYKTCTASTGGGGSEGGGNWVCTNYQAQHKSNWKVMPCVTDRYYNSTAAFDYTDAVPGNARYLNGHDGSRRMLSWDSANTALATNINGTTSARATDHWNFDQTGECYDVDNANIMMPLTNNVATLKARINALKGFGGTAGTLGTAMTWYTLSPNWANVWGASSAPKAYNLLTQTNARGKPKLRKVAVLMTDGVYNSYRGWKDQNKTTMSNAAKQMCTNMKAQGIEVYTVGFSLNLLPAADYSIAVNTLQNCGSGVDHFYNTLSGSDLEAAFTAIGNNIRSGSVGNIRLAR